MLDVKSFGAVAFPVDADTRAAKSACITIMLPADLIAAIDKATNSRSRFLAEAARLKLPDAA